MYIAAMGERTHILAQEIFRKPTVEACDLQEIKEYVQHYPYFAPAQFLLLEKLKLENSPECESQLQKAVLYYHDPLEFEYFISSGRFYTELELEEEFQADVFSESNEIGEIPFAVSNVKEPSIVTELQTATPQPLTFEPYHTVDYFASQGIKLTAEEVPIDKFGKQLKSFTEWLKTMKRLPAKDIIQNLDNSTESNVKHLAEDSVHETDVLTESMAEVWLKQGNIDKALEVYDKLSLLNPSKKAYFAGKIEHLKHS